MVKIAAMSVVAQKTVFSCSSDGFYHFCWYCNFGRCFKCFGRWAAAVGFRVLGFGPLNPNRMPQKNV